MCRKGLATFRASLRPFSLSIATWDEQHFSTTTTRIGDLRALVSHRVAKFIFLDALHLGVLKPKVPKLS
jgi:hypothetical protein